MIIHPGETTIENMKFLGITMEDMEKKTGIDRAYWASLVYGGYQIDYKTALKLEEVFGPSAEFWLNLEHNYQLGKLEEVRGR